MKASKAKRIAPRLEKPSADKLAGIVRRIDAYVPSDLPELPELDKMVRGSQKEAVIFKRFQVLELNGFPSCTVDLPSSNVAQSASTERVGREANAEGDADVWLTTKRAILRDEKNTLPYDTTKQRILDYYSGVDGDADIQTERLKVTLICPVSIR